MPSELLQFSIGVELKARPNAEVLPAYLRVNPIALALFRSSELRPLEGLRFECPVLDVGCGAGEFAAAALTGEIDVGIDVSPTKIRNAQRRGGYLRVEVADGKSLPYENDSFATVICVSVLEHIGDVQSVVEEVYRVLRPGGQFVFTVVLRDIHEQSPAVRFLGALGAPAAGRLLNGLFDRVFRHVTLWSAEQWLAMIEENGLEIVDAQRTVSSRLLGWFEFFLLTAWPYRVAMAVGRPWCWRPLWLSRLLSQALRPVAALDGGQGVCLFVRARKPPAGFVAP